MHATSCANERNWSLWGNVFTKSRNRLGIEKAEKVIFIRGNSDQVTVDDDNIMLSLLEQPEPTAVEGPSAQQGGDERAEKRPRTAV